MPILFLSFGASMAQTDLVIHIDDDLKVSGEALFHSYGLNTSAGIATLLKHAVEQGKMPAGTEPQKKDSDFQLNYSAADILQDEADFCSGRIQATDWEVVKARANAI
jgi:addiction module RelB/DinJ family antitoxin